MYVYNIYVALYDVCNVCIALFIFAFRYEEIYIYGLLLTSDICQITPISH